MKKNNHSSENGSRGHRNSDRETNRNTAILVLAIIFFLLALGLWAASMGYNPFRMLGLRFGGNMGGTGRTGTMGGGQLGAPGARGPGGAGGTGTNGSNDAQNPNGIKNLDVNIKTDTGLELNAGIDDQGQLYVEPQANPNAQGGTGAEGSLNNNKVIDTNSVLQ